MVQFNTKDNEILVKIVYYGTGLSGKTTNLQKLHEMTDPSRTTDLFSVNTMEDRTLFFDLLPLDLGYVYGNTIKLQIYTVPGQVHYDSTRRIVLSGADGVVFVADSDEAKLQENVQSINNLFHNLQANRLNIKEVPLVMQYNKRDLPNLTSVDVLNQKLNFRNVPFFEAVAIGGQGVLETFMETVRVTIRYIFEKYQLSKSSQNVDGVIEKLEKSLMENAKKVAVLKKTELPARGEPTSKTVLKYDHDHKGAGEKGSQEHLLQKALTSNMETARLYTQLKKAQEVLVRKNKELEVLYQRVEKSNNDNQKMRRFLESLVNFAGEAIITFNEKWSIQNWNQAAEELFGYKRDDVVGKNIELLFPEDNMADLNRVLSFVIKGKVVRGFETLLEGQDGAVAQVSITFSPIKDKSNVIVAFTAIVRDLSFMNRIIGQIRAMQRHESVGNLIPDILELLLNNESALPAQLNHSLRTMARLAEPSQSKEPCNLNDLLLAAYHLVESRLQKRGIGWSAQLFPSPPLINLNRDQMTQAILDLFLNAFDAFTPEAKGKITVGTHAANGEILMQFIDNGAAVLPPGDIDRTLDSTINDKMRLRGIRISVVREIVVDQGGSFRIDSNPGKGTKVTIRFPVN